MSEPVYSVTVKREVIAQHYLVGADFGPENERNSHRYEIEARYEGPTLDEYGFLVDIDAVGAMLDALVDRYRDRTLNDLPEFEGLNPSVEHFARILADRLVLDAPNVTHLEVTIWEHAGAAAGYRRSLDRGG
ncbi:MAG TPA: 6-carboxytetrahydropterin synthase [Solirubrobacteraceae bacterium]|jgi:6-pyruvoyltetrahydropterin/6-carboxytetrahydropterin synthase|nr:6-carboxytetrahydropterin synthase [Solirubrobacteraceae bacterium]